MLLVDGLMLLLHFTFRRKILQTLDGQPLVTSWFWRTWNKTLSYSFALSNPAFLIQGAWQFNSLQKSLNHMCDKTLNDEYCESTRKEWKDAMTFQFVPALVALFLIATSVPRARSYIRKSTTKRYQPHTLAVGHLLFVIYVLLYTPLASPDTFWKHPTHSAWSGVFNMLSFTSVFAWIIALALTVDGIIRLWIQHQDARIAQRRRRARSPRRVVADEPWPDLEIIINRDLAPAHIDERY